MGIYQRHDQLHRPPQRTKTISNISPAVAPFATNVNAFRLIERTASAFKLRELPIKAAQRNVSILSGNFENEEIGEAYSLVLAKPHERRLDDVWVLNGQLLVVKQHFNHRGDLLARALVD